MLNKCNVIKTAIPRASGSFSACNAELVMLLPARNYDFFYLTANQGAIFLKEKGQ